MSFPINAAHRLLLESTDRLLLEDGSSFLVLDEQIALDDPLTAATGLTLTPTLTFVGSIVQPPNPPLSDDFNDNSIDVTKWQTFIDTGVTLLEVNQEIEITQAAIAGYGTLNSINPYDLRGTAVYSQLVSAGNQTLQMDCIPVLISDVNGFNELFWNVTNNTLAPAYSLATVTTVLGQNAPYNPAIHRWFRIRENSGMIFWEYSADGNTWIEYIAVSESVFTWGVSSMFIGLQTGIWGTAGTSTTKFDNFNIGINRLSYEVQIDTVNTFDSQ